MQTVLLGLNALLIEFGLRIIRHLVLSPPSVQIHISPGIAAGSDPTRTSVREMMSGWGQIGSWGNRRSTDFTIRSFFAECRCNCMLEPLELQFSLFALQLSVTDFFVERQLASTNAQARVSASRIEELGQQI